MYFCHILTLKTTFLFDNPDTLNQVLNVMEEPEIGRKLSKNLFYEYETISKYSTRSQKSFRTFNIGFSPLPFHRHI
jgi:hypothetical protein